MKPTEELEFHPIANNFPLMSPEKLSELAADIKENGCHTALILYEGKILDGRNRYNACCLVGENFDTEEFKHGNPIAYAWSHNNNRMHYTTGQLAMISANFSGFEWGGYRLDGKEAASLPLDGKPLTQAAAADMVGVSERSVRTAVKVQAKAEPEVVESVKAGKTTLSSAAKTIKKEKTAGYTEEQIEGDLAPAFKKIGLVLGTDFVKALKSGALPMGPKDLVAFSNEPADAMREYEPLLVGNRWDLKHVKRFLSKMPDEASKVSDLISFCLSGGGKYEATVNSYRITVEYLKRK